MTESTDVVEVPREVVARIEKRVDHTEFESTSEYVTHLLLEVLDHVEEVNQVEDVDAVDKEEVTERLKSLGYLNQ